MYSPLKHLNYSMWATSKLAQVIEKADPSIIKMETPSSFNTIEKTILHIWDAEQIWLKRLRGESIDVWPSQDFAGDRDDLIEGWINSSIEMRDYVTSQAPEYIHTIIEYKNMSGKPFSNTVEEIIHHVVNHGTYHRGQIITMLRANGFTDLDSTDLINYLRVG